MKERIQEMARQAGAQHRLNLGVEEFCFEHHELKKFAEFIVRECCQFNYDFLESYREACEVNGKIREHFGVEE